MSVHAGPEAAMLEHAELPVAGQADQGVALENAALLRRKIGQEIAVKEEVTAIDPVVEEFGFLAEFLDLGVLDLELAEPRGWIDPKTVPNRFWAR